MKSKSNNSKQSPIEGGKHDKTSEFANFYKSAADINKLSEKHTPLEGIDNENNFSSKHKIKAPKREISVHKSKKKNKHEVLDISQINIDGRNLEPNNQNNSPVNSSKNKYVPHNSGNSKSEVPKVKSIMKNTSLNIDDAMDDSTVQSVHKRKKRNKSVSFMLDDDTEIVIKKTKSDDSLRSNKKSEISRNNVLTKPGYSKDSLKYKKSKHKKNQDEKENKKDNLKMEIDQGDNISTNDEALAKKSKFKTEKSINLFSDTTRESSTSDSLNQKSMQEKKKKIKKHKKYKTTDESSDPTEHESTNNNEEINDTKDKKIKKKKRRAKFSQPDSTETEGEPYTKARKKEVKPEVIAEDLENLSIGDNAHTLTNLLDEMTVADKKKKKKRSRSKKEMIKNTTSVSSSETVNIENTEQKDKVKWRKRWNKDKKGENNEDDFLTSVIVENLPLSIISTYKTSLPLHFAQFGIIKRVGVAETYPTVDAKPVFTTSITFHNEEAATKALEEDNIEYSGNRIRVRRPLPRPQTTVVVRSYGDLTEQSLSAIFAAAGRLRTIRILPKSRYTAGTAFIEFDGPESVERALNLTRENKIGGKKIYVSRFELRPSVKNKEKFRKKIESENEGDSENSND